MEMCEEILDCDFFLLMSSSKLTICLWQELLVDEVESRTDLFLNLDLGFM